MWCTSLWLGGIDVVPYRLHISASENNKHFTFRDLSAGNWLMPASVLATVATRHQAIIKDLPHPTVNET